MVQDEPAATHGAAWFGMMLDGWQRVVQQGEQGGRREEDSREDGSRSGAFRTMSSSMSMQHAEHAA